MSQTLLLDPLLWDLMVDANRNIAVADEPYSLAQDAASAIRTFLEEVYYDTTQGVPYQQSIFGKPLILPLLKAQLESTALTVPGIVSATVFISSFSARVVSGQVQVTDSNGTTTTASF